MTMASSLKARANLYLMPVIAFDALAEYGILFQPDFAIAAQIEAFKLAASSVLFIAIGIVLTGLLSANAKARLVFWRWRHPLPGSRAFTEVARTDPRVDLARIRNAHGTLPRAPDQQNRLWYQIYQRHQRSPAVSDTHLRFLFCRDGAAASVILFLFVGAIVAWARPAALLGVAALTLLALQYLFFAIAGRFYGDRMICSVLALESSEAGKV